MNVICIEEKAFLSLIGEVIKYVKSEIKPVIADKWIGKKEAMRLLRIKSPTTLQKLKDGGKSGFRSPKRNTSFTIGIPSSNILEHTPKILFDDNQFFHVASKLLTS